MELEEILALATGEARATLEPAERETIEGSRKLVEEAASSGRLVYGINTGVGELAKVQVEATRLREMQHELVRSHAAAVGDPLAPDVVRAMLALKAKTFTTGVSGVRLEVAERYVELLNLGLVPVVPCQGSLGASGDLALLAHLALPAIGEGQVDVEGERMAAADALEQHGLEPLRLSHKEGLSLINGTEGMLALGILALHQAEVLADAADSIAAMTVEAALGTDRAFHEDVVGLRRHPGAKTAAENLRAALERSEIVASHKDSDHLVQDAYSLRCIPQVHGAYRDGIAYVRATLQHELASGIDNPSIVAGGEIVSGGNFHGESLAIALDHLTLCVTGFGTISERRIARLVDPHLNQGLPAFLTPDPGRRSGFMIAHYTAASLVSENRAACFPASADSIPTSAGQEDHVSMGATSGRKALEVLRNTFRVLAIEAMAAAQALDLRAPLSPSPVSARNRAAVREVSAHLDEDRSLSAEVHAVADLIRAGRIS